MDRNFIMKCLSLAALTAGVVAAQSVAPRRDIPAIAKAANGAVVSIVMSDKDGKPIAQGSGFLVSKDGVIITNYHVIAEGTSALVKLPDGAFFVVDGVLAFDKARDVAVIKAHGENFRTLTLGDSDRVQVGQEVVAIGNPLSLESTVSNGIVSSIRTIDEGGGKYLQVTAPISPGSSGGPLFNMAGEVVGITTMYIKGGENLNFAIPINDAKHLLLAKSAELANLPNESESVKVQTPDRDAPSSVGLTTDRDYYKQLYDAGGFFKSIPVTSNGKPDISTTLERAYVCFNDDAHSGLFFAFEAIAYDETYAKAFDKATQIMFTKDWRQDPEKVDEFVKATNTEETIQRELPYVGFLDDQIISAFPPNFQQLFRKGGRVLEVDFYTKGVKSNTAEYHWDGKSWVLQYGPEDPNADLKTTRTFQLSIEPTTLRYTEFLTITLTTGSGDEKISSSRTAESSSGVCEKIPDKH